MAFRDINPAPLNPLAYGDMVGSIGANVLAGQERGQRDALVMNKMSQDMATQNALAGYFATPEADRGRALNELAALDPKVAGDVLTIENAQRDRATIARKEQAMQEYTEAQFVLKASHPAQAIKLLDSDGMFLRQLEEAGMIDSSDGLSDDEARLIAQWALDTTAPIAGITADQDSFARKLDTVESRIARPLSDEEVLKLAGGGTTINIGDKLNEPIPIAQIDSVRMPDGRAVPIGTTFQQARDAGAQVQSPAEQARGVQRDAALGILGELESLALGPGGAFANVEPGFVNRAGSAIMHGLNLLTQDDPAAARYEDMSKSTLAPFIKFLGESGALADGDVQRALGLLPRSFPLPDTKDIAQQKFRALREIIERGVQNSNRGGAPGAGALPPLPPGFTLDEQ